MSDNIDQKFIKKASYLIFVEFRMLSISKFSEGNDNDKNNQEKFLHSSVHTSLKFLKVINEAPCYAILESYQSGLISILSSVKHEVFLERLCFNNQTLKFVMEQ